MSEEIIDDPNPSPGNQVPNPTDGNWYDSLAGEDKGRIEVLSQYETPDSFFDAFNGAMNRDWRAEIAGDDDKFKSKLERFAEPAQFGTAYREAEQKIRAGDIGPKLPDEPTDEQVKEYRNAIGVPIEAEGYLKELPDGLVIGDDDKEIVGGFVEEMHKLHTPPVFVHAALGWYTQLEEQMQEARVEMDAQQSRDATDELREAWGKDYRTNINVINNFLDAKFGKETREQFVNGRFQDGTGFLNEPHVMKVMAQIARESVGVADILPNDTNQIQSLTDEIAELEKYMREKRHEYNKDVKAQKRLEELYDIRLNLEKKSAA